MEIKTLSLILIGVGKRFSVGYSDMLVLRVFIFLAQISFSFEYDQEN